MRAIQHQLTECQAVFGKHPFFASLRDDLPIDRFFSFAPRLTFWVLGFQDILRLNEQLITDPKLHKIARHHRREDAGHESWFLSDVGKLSQVPSAEALFGASHRRIREATFSLAAETFRAPTDRVRVVLLLLLESMGHVFFERIARLVEHRGLTGELRYFSDFHLKVEKSHQVFEAKVEEELFAQVLEADERDAALNLVARGTEAFILMFNALIDEADAGPACVESGRMLHGS